MLPEIHKKNARLDWTSDVNGPMALPSTQVRQVLINTAPQRHRGGRRTAGWSAATCRRHGAELLRITIEDDGDP